MVMVACLQHLVSKYLLWPRQTNLTLKILFYRQTVAYQTPLYAESVGLELA